MKKITATVVPIHEDNHTVRELCNLTAALATVVNELVDEVQALKKEAH